MNEPLEILESSLRAAVDSSGWEWPTAVSLGVPANVEFGEVTTDLAFRLAARVGKSPHEIAALLISQISLPAEFAAGEPAGGGHLNFRLSPSGWESLFSYWHSPAAWRRDDYQGQAVVVEYSSPNVGRPFQVGHLRTTVLGDVVARLYEASGARVTRVNHLGDWGTQFGKLIVAIRRWSSEKELATDSVDKLLQLYVRFHEAAESEPGLEDEARAWSKKIEDGDPEAVRWWRQVVDWSVAEYQRLYEVLGVQFDHLSDRGESFYTREMMMAVVDELRAAGLARESEGAVILSFPDEELPSTVLIRSDGGTVYLLRDLAALKYRLTEWRADKVIYFVGAEQSLHFKQLFRAAVLLGWMSEDEAKGRLQHAANGLYRLPEGKMSTRKGRGILMRDLLSGGLEKAQELIAAKSPTLTAAERQELAEKIAVASIKYNDLSHHRQSSFTFTWEKALSLEGNSAPYLMYSLARAWGIFRKAGEEPQAVGKKAELLTDARERWLILTPWRWQALLRTATRDASPNLLCDLLFDAARHFNAYYNDTPILVEDPALRAARLSLCAAVISTLEEGMRLLGLPTVRQL